MKVKMKTIFAAMAAGFVSLAQVEAQDLNTAIKELDANRTCAAKENFDKLNATGTADGSFAYGYYLLRTRQPDLAKAAFEKVHSHLYFWYFSVPRQYSFSPPFYRPLPKVLLQFQLC